MKPEPCETLINIISIAVVAASIPVLVMVAINAVDKTAANALKYNSCYESGC